MINPHVAQPRREYFTIWRKRTKKKGRLVAVGDFAHFWNNFRPLRRGNRVGVGGETGSLRKVPPGCGPLIIEVSRSRAPAARTPLGSTSVHRHGQLSPSVDDLYFGTAVITEGPATMGRAPCSRGARYQMADIGCVHASHVLPPIAMTSLGDTCREHRGGFQLRPGPRLRSVVGDSAGHGAERKILFRMYKVSGPCKSCGLDIFHVAAFESWIVA